MKVLYVMILLSLAAGLASAKRRTTEKDVISYAKSLDVSKLDSTLRSQHLDKWLRSGPARLDTVEWEMSNCDLKPDPGDTDAPLCAKFRFTRGAVSGWGLINVGTFRMGISGPPHFEYITFFTDVPREKV